MRFRRYALGVGSVVCLTLVLGTGCATKKYVAKQVAPVDERLKQNEKRTSDQATSIEGLETGLAKTKEQMLDIDANLAKTNQKLEETGNRTTQAASAAAQAQQQASDAQKYAEKRSNHLETLVDNIDAHKLMRSTSVLFDTARAEVGKEGQATLDQIAQEAASKKHYVFEVQGFTDSRGSKAGNLTLSQRRAEAVVRYLTMNCQIPLRSIHLIGAGQEAPVADNKTREGRKQNRRVEVRLFALEFDLSSAVAPAQLR